MIKFEECKEMSEEEMLSLSWEAPAASTKTKQ